MNHSNSPDHIDRLLIDLECAVHDAMRVQDIAFIQAQLHIDFLEYGFSGRVYDRDGVLALLKGKGASEEVIHAHDFQVDTVREDVCLVTYQTFRRDEYGEDTQFAWRTSLWAYEHQKWLMVMHQCTPKLDKKGKND